MTTGRLSLLSARSNGLRTHPALPAGGAPGAGKIVLAYPWPHGRDQDDPACGWRGDTGWVRVVVTEIGWDGSMRRRALDTSGLTKAGRWEDLIEQVLAFPRRPGRLRAARSMSSTPVTALSWWVSRTSPARCATW